MRGPPAPPPLHATVADALRAAAGHGSGVTFVDLRERETALGWAEVARRAGEAAGALSRAGVRPGDQVAIVLRTEPAFLDAFLGAAVLGAVPVPLYPPVRLGRLEEWTAATARMIEVSGARLVVSGGASARLLGEAVARARPPLGWLAAERLLGGPPAPPRAVRPEDLALVQFSSGSTVDPKPVALTHRALTAQIASLVALVRPTSADVLVSWLPLYHDMGLIGCLLGALSYPGPLVLLPPEHFLARPSLWLRAISRHRGTISAAPSFGYSYAAERAPAADLDGLDLSSWRIALDGAEPVSPLVLRRFADRLAPHGLDPRGLLPVYGLSEAALAVSFCPPRWPLRTVRADARRLAAEGLLAPGEREIASVGVPVPGVEVEVRGARGEPLPPGRVGRIHVRSPSLMREYLGQQAATAAALRGGWLDTGDLGFEQDGELYVHGRAKDLVVVRGANHAPEEFEGCLAGVAGLRPGCAVAIGQPGPSGEEGLWILAERAAGAGGEEEADLAEEVRRAVTERTGVAPAEVRILAPGTLPRTSSGKLRRGEARRRLEAGALLPPSRPGALALLGRAARSALVLRRLRTGEPHG
ncbi:MAG: AMP-binding protein [Deltaproteobacteria bacterium]|nr:AMP-binding protein [Deltaproteobacteria bacterium]